MVNIFILITFALHSNLLYGEHSSLLCVSVCVYNICKFTAWTLRIYLSVHIHSLACCQFEIINLQSHRSDICLFQVYEIVNILASLISKTNNFNLFYVINFTFQRMKLKPQRAFHTVRICLVKTFFFSERCVMEHPQELLLNSPNWAHSPDRQQTNYT